MNNRLNILCQSSDFYAPLCGVMLESLFYNNQDIETIKVYLISGGIDKKNLFKLDALSEKYHREIEIIDGVPIVQKIKDYGCAEYRGSYATYFKVFFPDYINEDIDRLLYLDCDIIIDDSLKELLNIDMQGKSMAMALELIPKNYLNNIIEFKGNHYYNCGVMLFDCKAYIEHDVPAKIIYHVNNCRSKYATADQDLFNFVAGDDIFTLDLKYNFQHDCLSYGSVDMTKKIYDVEDYYSEEEFNNALKGAVVYHYSEGAISSRPWWKNSNSMVVDKWDKYLAQSPWNDFEKSKEHIDLFHKFRRVLYKILPKNVFAFVNRKSTILFQRINEKKLMTK